MKCLQRQRNMYEKQGSLVRLTAFGKQFVREKDMEKIRTTIYLEKDLHKKAKILAVNQGSSLSGLLKDYLEDQTKEICLCKPEVKNVKE